MVTRQIGLCEVHQTFVRWLGDDYDLAALDVVLAVAAAERLTGDPAWLLVVGGSGAAKTETVLPLAGAGALVTSVVTSDAALLSGTPAKDRTKAATGGLLRKIGGTGLLVIKDVTSILSMNRDARSSVLAALREVYDGRWERNVGADGGRTLTWTGRIVVIGAVTTAWDKAHSVIAAMGDRFLLVRLDTTTARIEAGHQAMANTGNELAIRAELSGAVGALLSTVDSTRDARLSVEETERLLALAEVVTLARTAVERDYRGDVIDAHAPEMPTRFAKQLTQVVRGAAALGIDRDCAVALASRVAADSMPPLRLRVLIDLVAHPASNTHQVRVRLDQPRATVDRELQALHILGLLHVEEAREQYDNGWNTVWRYTVANPDHGRAVALLGTARSVTTQWYGDKKRDVGSLTEPSPGPYPDTSGTGPGSEHEGAP